MFGEYIIDIYKSWWLRKYMTNDTIHIKLQISVIHMYWLDVFSIYDVLPLVLSENLLPEMEICWYRICAVWYIWGFPWVFTSWAQLCYWILGWYSSGYCWKTRTQKSRVVTVRADKHSHSALFDVVTPPLSCPFSYLYIGPSYPTPNA